MVLRDREEIPRVGTEDFAGPVFLLGVRNLRKIDLDHWNLFLN